MEDIKIVITMAGLGSRFREAGYTVPKYQIMAHGKTLFEWSLASLEGYRDGASSYVFLVRGEDDASSFIKEKAQALGIRHLDVVELAAPTDGQATTALLAAPYWSAEEELLVYNIDTYVQEGQMTGAALKGDGFIPCFKGEGDHWSFVRLDDSGRAVEVKEKQRISEHCTLGAYYFKSCGLYERLYRDLYTGAHGLKEKYIAPMYNLLIQQGGEVFIEDIPPEMVHVLGTPEELRVFLSKPVPGAKPTISETGVDGEVQL